MVVLENDLKFKDLEWNVFVEDFNNKKIRAYNIFNHYGFMSDCKDAWKKSKKNFDEFAETIRKSLMYYYWSKCEWEIILSDWPPSGLFKEEKVDVYQQIMLNWGPFINYLWKTLHGK